MAHAYNQVIAIEIVRNTKAKYYNMFCKLKEEIEKYRADYEENTKRLNEISTNPDAIEQIAREKYLMKKPNEDIYVFEE